MSEKEMSAEDFAAEKLRLERASLDLQRERLEAERSRFEREMEIRRNHPERSLVGFITSLICIVAAFAGGYSLGLEADNRAKQRDYEERLARALENLEVPRAPTNIASNAHLRVIGGNGKTNVSVIVIQ